MTKALQKRIKELNAQIERARSEKRWSEYFELQKSFGIMLLNER